MSPEGSFGAVRKHDVHTGVDLYTREGAPVFAMESGKVVSIEQFTGGEESPWWLPTWAVLVEGASGVIVYGEIAPEVTRDSLVNEGDLIGRVLPVLREDKVREDIPGHSRFMLHLELHVSGTRKTSWWNLNEPQPDGLLDPRPILSRAWNERAV